MRVQRPMIQYIIVPLLLEERTFAFTTTTYPCYKQRIKWFMIGRLHDDVGSDCLMGGVLHDRWTLKRVKPPNLVMKSGIGKGMKTCTKRVPDKAKKALISRRTIMSHILDVKYGASCT